MKGTFIETRNVKVFRHAIETLCDIAGVQAGMGVVYGPANTGKTECARHYAAHSDAIYISIDADMSSVDMLSALCAKCGKPGLHTTDDCLDYLLPTLESAPIPILVDHAERIDDYGIIEHLRDIHDSIGAPVVFIGRPEVIDKIRLSQRTWNRVVETVEFKPVSFE